MTLDSLHMYFSARSIYDIQYVIVNIPAPWNLQYKYKCTPVVYNIPGTVVLVVCHMQMRYELMSLHEQLQVLLDYIVLRVAH